MKNLVFLCCSLLCLLVGLPQRAMACACCANPNTLELATKGPFLSWSQPRDFSGALGVYIYGEAGGPDFPVGESTVIGKANSRSLTLSVTRDGRTLGDLELKLIGPPEISRVGMDIILPEKEFQKLQLNEPPVSHQWKQAVEIRLSPTLSRNLGARILPRGVLLLHGYGNACWTPEEHYSGTWTLLYRVTQGKKEIPAMGRGSF